MSNYPDFSSYDYQVIRELGRNREGGRISYLADRISQSQQVVIKQFRFAQEDASWQGFKAYEREIEILQQLDHPRIPRYLDSFETGDGFCMVQEYKDAPSLASRSSFKTGEIKQIAVSVLEILVDIQKRIPPIIHRDIKPENILIDAENNVYLIDFGLARVNNQDVAVSSIVAGTPGYMPPESLFNRPLTTASDLYSLGATIIGLLTNTPSVEISNLIDENYQFNIRHLVTGINSEFITWLSKMVAPSLKERYPHAIAALQALKSIDVIGTSTSKSRSTNITGLVTVGTSLTGIFTMIGFLSFYQQSASKLQRSRVSQTNISTAVVSVEKQWFDVIKPRCNSVEVITAMSNSSYPQTPKGVGYAASCYALAGKIELADKVIQELPTNLRVYAAQVVFNIAHPVADAGDDKSAGPMMDLVLKYWSSNYMALYHAGMSAYVLGEYPKAQTHLQKFLRIYKNQDGWRQKAILALSRIKKGIAADKSFSIHH
ncbi:MAG: protein kinase [Nostocaceae cyanobacterium]|nr:protein kinase [Nostocaceae cyanobacterium]